MPQPGSEASIEAMLAGLRAGDAAAANKLTHRYFERVVRAAAKRLPSGRPLLGTGPEDVAASVFESIWARAADGRFSEGDLADGDELWRLLCKMTASKAIDHARRERAAKRGGGLTHGESAFLPPPGGNRGDSVAGIGGVAGKGFTPDELAAFSEGHERLMGALNGTLREVATLRLEGYEVKEIAAKLGLTDRSIKRKLAMIREEWSEVLAESVD